MIQQLVTGYIGGTILYLYFKLKGKEITFSQILDEVNPKSGIKKYYYTAFYLGVAFIILFVLVISTLSGLNPKISNIFK